MSVLLETSVGDIVVDLFDDIAPNACTNFLKLCKIKYYNDCEFFRIEKGFVAQTGDPENTGKGGEAVFAKCSGAKSALLKPEVSLKLTHSRKGRVSLTAAASDTNIGDVNGHGSQFFITLDDDLTYLDGTHTVFGQVEEGMDVVDKLASTYVDDSFRPYRILRIRHTIILHDPFDDPDGLPADVPSPEPIQVDPDDRLGSDDEDMVDDETDEETLRYMREAQNEREAKSRAEVLEMIGDIGDADMKPPENVLFICKLNPVTEAEDLEIIFSRFGECNADILRDKDTGDSLCYGFIEFDTKAQCEKAYFKMDNVLIDDRRIHVDFSQSVSRLWNAARRSRTNRSGGQQRPNDSDDKTKFAKRQRLDPQVPEDMRPPLYISELKEHHANPDTHESNPLRRGSSNRRAGRSRFDQRPGDVT